MPSLLNSNIDTNLEPKLKWLQQRLSLTDDELSKLIQQLPSLLGYNIETNLEPTMNFYINVLRNESKAFTFVTHNPSSFGYSLEKRLKPRLQEAQDAGMIVDSKFLNSMMTYTEDGWNKRLLKEIDM